ncbi:hypothetical protein LAZ67_4003795 [Cordylochernes scorpioides]|uniref:Histone-lysine N-methyltransferase SETMAR n=1 Tax=Cordylochernes scorpioides TaxID=51811 RepID=A0ABY6KIN8_9ARAC|nr:hypothetical protein LAZ67_4003795 [Cordylochernes scorpioides]
MLTKGVRFHHDNARPHTAHQTTALIEEFEWELVSHPPYSPDVAPSDFHFFPELKKNLGETQFQDDDELEEEVLGFLRGQAAEFFDSGFHKWDQHGILYYELLQPGETGTAHRYQQQLTQLRQKMAVKRPEWTQRHGKLILLHDNVRPHVAQSVRDTLKNVKWEVTRHTLQTSFHRIITSSSPMAHGLANQRFQNSEEVENWL